MKCDGDCEYCEPWSASDDSSTNSEQDISEASLAKSTII